MVNEDQNFRSATAVLDRPVEVESDRQLVETNAQQVTSSKPAKSSPKKKVRLSLDISGELNDKVEELAEEINGTKSDVLRRAIALLDLAIQARKDGKKFGIAEKSQQLTTEIVGI